MNKSQNANYSGPFKVGDYENYLSKFSAYATHGSKLLIKRICSVLNF